MTRAYTVFHNAETGAAVQKFLPIRLFFYDHSAFSYSLLNPLAKALLCGDSRFAEGRYLFEVSSDPEHADFLVFPCDLNYFEHREHEAFELMPYYAGNEARHVFFDRRDGGDLLSPGTAVHFRPSLQRHEVSRSVICIPYLEPVDNFFGYLHQPRDIRYDLSFLGERTDFRERLLDSLKREITSVCFHLRADFFFGGYMAHRPATKSEPEVTNAHRQEYIETIRRSRFVLAPKGYGTNSFRFYEALSLGVPPILVSDDCALPFERHVDYDAICLRFDARDPDVAVRIKDAVLSVDQARYERLCRLGRLYFDTYLSPRNFLFLSYEALELLVQCRQNYGNDE